MARNTIHESDREKASSLMANIHMPKTKRKLGKFHYIFNKK